MKRWLLLTVFYRLPLDPLRIFGAEEAATLGLMHRVVADDRVGEEKPPPLPGASRPAPRWSTAGTGVSSVACWSRSPSLTWTNATASSPVKTTAKG